MKPNRLLVFVIINCSLYHRTPISTYKHFLPRQVASLLLLMTAVATSSSTYGKAWRSNQQIKRARIISWNWYLLVDLIGAFAKLIDHRVSVDLSRMLLVNIQIFLHIFSGRSYSHRKNQVSWLEPQNLNYVIWSRSLPLISITHVTRNSVCLPAKEPSGTADTWWEIILSR